MAFVAGALLGAAAGIAIFRQTRRAPAWIASQGMARTFQNIRLFQEMTVLENVLVALDRRPWEGSAGGIRAGLSGWGVPIMLVALMVTLALAARAGSPLADAAFPSLGLLLLGYIAVAAKRGAFSSAHVVREQEAHRRARELLAFVGLDGKRNVVSGSLPYGEKRRLEIARALATSPKLVLLDEPAAGMNPAEAVGLMSLIRAIRDRGASVLLIEHHMRVVMGISDRIAVLEYGRKIAEGTPEEIRANPRVVEAYLGKDEEVAP
jgi:ABC-type branched-subunit amino acid transport system ATPase component